MKDDDAYRDKI